MLAPVLSDKSIIHCRRPEKTARAFLGFRARLHQSRFRVERLMAGWKDYGNRPAEKDALVGKNFYSDCDVFQAVQVRYPLKYSPLYYDMLRSEHIPFDPQRKTS